MKNKTYQRKLTGSAALLALLLGSQATAQSVSYTTTGATYTEDFDAADLSADTLTWTDDSVFSGWYAYQEATAGAPAEYRRSSLYSTSFEFYHWRDGASATDGAFGSVPETSTGNTIYGIRLTNDTGETLNSFTVGYTGEQWRETAAGNNRVDVSYQLGAADLASGSWTAINALDFNSPRDDAEAVPVTASANISGNDAANREVFTPETIALSTGWLDGTDLWIRWQDNDSSGLDQGLGIDDFNFTAVVPEPSHSAVLFGFATLFLVASRRASMARK